MGHGLQRRQANAESLGLWPSVPNVTSWGQWFHGQPRFRREYSDAVVVFATVHDATDRAW